MLDFQNQKEGVSAPSRNESESNYQPVVFLKPEWRVIECRDGIQWILQRRQKTHRRDAWRPISYCQTREALTRVYHAKSGDVHGMVELSKLLPERIGGGV